MNTSHPRIALYQPYPHSLAGLQTVVTQLAETLPAQGYEPLIISPEEGAFTEAVRARQLACLVCDPGTEWHVYGRGGKSWSYLLSPKRLFALVRYWFKLRGELRRNQIALLHCNDYRGVMLAAPAARLAGIPVLWHMHGFVSSWPANLVAAALVQWTVPVSHGMLDYLKFPRRLLGRHEVIHNGVAAVSGDGPSLSREPEAAVPVAEFPIVLAVGTLHPRKGYETLLRAFKRVSARMPQAECWIAGGEFGDGSHGRQLRELAASLGLAERVLFLGHSAEVEHLMERCAVLAVPSRVEVFGLVALEAMRAGKPVVACRTGGLPEIITHRETGVLVAPDDAVQMALALMEIIGNPRLAEKMGRAGRQRAQEEFSLEKMAAAFAALYGRRLDGRIPASTSFTVPGFWKRRWWRRNRPAPARLQAWHRSTTS